MPTPILRKHDAVHDLPSARCAHSMCATSDAFYVLGGAHRYGMDDSVLRMQVPPAFSPKTAVWDTLAPLPRPRSFAACVCLDQKIYLMGGVTAGAGDPLGGNTVAWVDIYDIASNTWSAGPDLPYSVRFAGAAILGRNIHMVGGLTPSHQGDRPGTHLILNLDTNAWSTPQATSTQDYIEWQCVVAVGAKLYAIAGMGPSGSGISQVYDPVSGSWSQIAPFPGASHGGGAAAVVGSSIVVFGQIGDPSLWLYDTSTNTWSQDSNDPLVTVIPGACAAAFITMSNAVLAVVSGGATLNSWSTKFVPVIKAEIFGYQVMPDPAPTADASALVPNVAQTAHRLRAIFGNDSRVEVTDISDQARANLAGAACGLFESARIIPDASGYKVVPASTLRSQQLAVFAGTPGVTIDSSIRFLNQPVAAFGSAALISPHYILTAAHNFFDQDGKVKRDPQNVWIAFGWTAACGNELLPGHVFKGRRVIRYSYSGSGASNRTDWAVVELGEANDPSQPASAPSLPTMPLCNADTPVQTQLWMVGHPSGLPLKYVDNAKVLATSDLSCSSNLDGFAANSGSPVLDEQNRLVGVFMSGPAGDYVLSGNTIKLGEFNAETPAYFARTAPIFDLQNAAAFQVRFKVGDDYWADSWDSLGFAIDAEPQRKFPSSFPLGWARNSSFSAPVEFANPSTFPEQLMIKKFTEAWITDDLQIVLVELWSGSRLIQRWGWLSGIWLTRSNNVISLPIDVRWHP